VIAQLESHAPAAPVAAVVYGAGMTAFIAVGAATSGIAIRRLADALVWPLNLAAEAWLLKTALSARGLIDAGRAVETRVAAGDLDGARSAVAALVSRDPTALDAELLVSAVVESLAENTADSIVAPLLAYALGGLPAAFAYRAINTLDAMIGYHGRYEYLGKTAARLDDLANLLPSRLAAGLLLAGGALAGGQVHAGWICLAAQHGRTESPNAGWPMSVMAGLLGIVLEKPGHYRLGDPAHPPDLPAIDHAAEIVNAATLLAGLSALAVAWIRRA